MDNSRPTAESITIDYIKNLNNYTEIFLCSLNDNIYDIRFLKFSVRDLD